MHKNDVVVRSGSFNYNSSSITAASSSGISTTLYYQSGSGTSVLYFTVPMDAPNTLYYQCTIHAGMNGTINVIV